MNKKRKKTTTLVVALFLLFVLVGGLTLGGCTKEKKKSAEEKTSIKSKKSVTSKKGGEPDTTVLMLGRSVMGGWFSHLGSDGSQPAKLDGFILIYGEISSPPDIVQGVEDKLKEHEGKYKIVFFKLCFADFYGGSREEARQNLKENENYVKKVYDIVVTQKHLPLIIGNALLMVKESTTEDVVWNHSQYNKFLNDFAASHSGEVYIFDQYSILATEKGYLRPDYATEASDSHPNDKAYQALDPALVELLRTIQQ